MEATVVEVPKPTESNASKLAHFYASSGEAWFPQHVVALVLGCSEAKLERDRWAGAGLPYSKFGRLVRYQKADVLAYLESGRQAHGATPARSDAAVAA